MALLTVQAITKAGLADLSGALAAADAAGDSVDAASGIFVAVENGDAAPHTLTILAPTATARCGNYGALPVDDIQLTVAAGATGLLAIPLGYADQGVFNWSYDDVTSVAVGVFSITP